VPTYVAAAPSAPLAPVANAVIKLGDATPKSAKPRATVDRAARARLWKRVLMGTLVVAVVGGLAAGLYALLAGRNHAFLRELASELPQDTVGVVALSSPRAVLELFGSEIAPEVREEATRSLGLDPFDVASLEAWGLDADAPLGVGLLDGDGMLAISVGVKDQAALRTALSVKAAALIKAQDDLRWIERSFGDVPGLWLDEPMSVAALLPAKRVIFVLGGDADAVARQAKRVAEAKGGETLADRPGFGEIEAERGKLLLAAYVDGGSGRAALPGKGFEVMAMRMALADIEGFALLLADDGPRVHLSLQTIVREDMSSLPALEGVRRKGELLDRIPAPALAELDMVFAPESFGSLVGGGLMRWGMSAGIEDEFRKETGLDLRADLLDNLDGQMGWVLQRLPAKGEDEDHFTAIGFTGLEDEEAAKRAAERFFAKMQGELDLELEQVEGTTVYVRAAKARDPKLSFFVHGKVAFVALGEVDIAGIVKGSIEPFRRKARIAALEEATAPGGQAAGFADIRELLAQARGLMSERELEDIDELAPVVSPLEALTMRAELTGRTLVVRFTLHTSSEQALAGLVQGMMKVVGADAVKDLARKRRNERCEQLVDHIYELMKVELNSADALMDQRFTMLEECRKVETTDTEIDCMLAVKTLAGLGPCEEGGKPTPEAGDDGITPVDVIEQPEPIPVPYVDDIWPNRTAAGTATGKPDAQVSYAVPLGDAPAVRGPEDALVTVVMFGDFQCPHCKRVLPTLDQLLASDREVRLVFRHNPLSMHPEAEIAARAALAAGAQGKLWEMHDKLYENQHALSEASFRLWAGELGLDLVRFDRDYADSATAEQVRADVALAKKFGATGTPAFFVNGRYLAGSQPLHAFQALVAEEKERAERFVDRRGKTRKRLYDDMIGHFAPEVVANTPTVVGTPVGEKRYTIDTSGLPRRGTAGFVRVEIVQCGDFDCPFCKRAETTLDSVLSDYDGKVALFWLHNPLSFHAGAEPAARAAIAADKQGKLWEMQDKLYEDATRRSDADFVGYARDLGLDTARFEADLRDPATATLVTEQQKICTDNDARGTPTFFINGRLLAGAQPYDKFKEVIDQELAGGI
jgi:protein-disulfide isomerase